MKKTLLLTGGHAATTAIAVVEEILEHKEKNITWQIHWVGARRAVEGKRMQTLEANFMPKLGVKMHTIVMGRLQRNFTLLTIPALIKIPFGFVHALLLLHKIKPDAVLSFGGFAGFPIVVVSFLLRIPVLIHEQTAAYGRANKASAFFATKILLARESSLEFFPKQKSVVVGNPVMSNILEVGTKREISSPPVVFVMGGSRGSQFINSLVGNTLDSLVKYFKVIHISGLLDYSTFEDKRTNLSDKYKDRYELYDIVPPLEIGKLYKKSDIVVSRAGANTVSELMLVRRPCLLIPLAISFQQEQKRNAQMLEKMGLAMVVEEKDANEKIFVDCLRRLKAEWHDRISNTKALDNSDKDAARKIVDVIQLHV